MKRTPKTLSVFFLAMINVSAICSIRNWPVAAEYGFASLFIILLAAVVFFIPVALVSAELATGWPKAGGIFEWVKEAFGHQWGFLAICYLWLTNIPWYPTLLSFIAGAIAFTFNPSLANNKLYIISMVLALFWVATFINLKGMKISGWISAIGVIAGTALPGFLIIGLGISWLVGGNPIEINMSWDGFLPKITDVNQLALIAGILFSFAGIEMSAVHTKDVINPQKAYPKAIFLSSIFIFSISILGALSIAIVTPKEEISFVSGVLDSMSYFFNAYSLSALIPITAFCIAVGAFGQVSTWVVGPSRGLLAAAQFGDLPKILRRTNANGMPVALMVFQGVVVSLLALVFFLMPTVTSTFWLLTALTAQYYLLLYILMFLASIYLSFKKPDVHRSYRVPGKKIGMLLIAGTGLISSLVIFLIGFIPPSQIDIGSLFFYETFLIAGVLLGSLVPFILLRMKKNRVY